MSDISSEFYDFPEALLTIGWSAYKLQDYQAAIKALNRIVKDYPKFYNVVEAHFVLGQCYLQLGYYDFAIKEYSESVDTTADAQDFSIFIEQAKKDVIAQEKQIDSLKTELLVLESKLLDTFAISNTGNGGLDEIVNQHKKNREEFEHLIKEIFSESHVFDSASNLITDRKRQIAKAEQQKNWQSYAEFGKARALYLKGTER